MLHRYQNDFVKIVVSFFESLGSLVGVDFLKIKITDKSDNVYVFFLDKQEVHFYEKKKEIIDEGK